MATVTIDQLIQDEITKLKAAWDDVKTKDSLAAVELLVQAVDELINFVETNYAIPGSDKKTLVLAAIDAVYDHYFAGMLPLLVRPFSGLIKSFVLNEAVSAVIDFIVSKYNAGNWVTPVTSSSSSSSSSGASSASSSTSTSSATP